MRSSSSIRGKTWVGPPQPPAQAQLGQLVAPMSGAQKYPQHSQLPHGSFPPDVEMGVGQMGPSALTPYNPNRQDQGSSVQSRLRSRLDCMDCHWDWRHYILLFAAVLCAGSYTLVATVEDETVVTAFKHIGIAMAVIAFKMLFCLCKPR